MIGFLVFVAGFRIAFGDPGAAGASLIRSEGAYHESFVEQKESVAEQEGRSKTKGRFAHVQKLKHHRRRHLHHREFVVQADGRTRTPQDFPTFIQLKTMARKLSLRSLKAGLRYQSQMHSQQANISTVYTPKTGTPSSSWVSQNGIVSWFQSSGAGAATWANAAATAAATNGSAPKEATASPGNKIVVVQNERMGSYLTGSPTDSYVFGTILPGNYTICSASRYGNAVGAQRSGFILTSSNKLWAHGHQNGYVGVASYGQWVTSNYAGFKIPTWVVMCGSSDGIHASDVYTGQGYNIGNGKVGATGSLTQVTVNLPAGGVGGVTSNSSASNLTSDWALMEVITWNRIITPAEVNDVVSWLNYQTQPFAAPAVVVAANVTVKASALRTCSRPTALVLGGLWLLRLRMLQ